MQSFSIACTTCQVQLRVRSSAAIGQILTCPKCGSMVLVEAPDEPATDSVAALESNSESASATPAIAGPLSASTDSQMDPSELADTVEDLSLYGTPPDDADDSESNETQPIAPGPPPTVAGPLLPNDDWTSAQSRKWRNPAIVVGAGVSGVVLALCLFGLVSGSLSGTPRTPDNSQSEESLPAEDLESTKQPPDKPILTTNRDTEIALPEMPAADLGQAESETPVDETPADQAEVDPTESNDETSQSNELATESTTSSDATVPPGFTAQAVSSADAAAALDSALQELESAVSDTPPPPMPDAESTELETAADAVTGESPDATRLPRPAPREIDLAERLDDPIQAIAFDGTPLSDFVQFITEYSTIPITLHPESLIWLKITPQSEVSVNESDSTVAEVLTTALKPLGLGFEVVDDQLVIGRPPSVTDGSLRPAPFDVADLTSDQHTGAMLATMISALVAPSSWEVNHGPGKIEVEESTLVVHQKDAQLFEVLFFLEKLRVARGSSPRSRFDARLFQLPTRTVRAAEKLDQPISLNYIRPTSFAAILDRLSESSGVDLLIDWQSLGEIGWTPDSEVQFQASGQPLREALTVLLEPMELSYRVVDDTVIQITTPNRLMEGVELEFHGVRELLVKTTAAELTYRLRRAIASLPHDTTVIRFDELSGCLVVMAPQPVHEAITAVLNAWHE